MLNPEFRWLDPETEQLERLSSLAPAGEEIHPEPGNPQEMALQLTRKLARPGIQPERAIASAIRELGGQAQPREFLGWPRPLLETVFGRYPDPKVLVLGVFDGDGLWASCLAGVSRGGLDFLATFRFLWNDEPELASKQTLNDLPDLCRAASRRFGRPAAGLFIWRNEFDAWRSQNWSWDLLQQYTHQQTAVIHNL